MSNSLPPETEAQLRRQFARGINAFRDGGSLAIGGLLLHCDKTEQRFTINCFSSCYYFENITRAEAEERIATAKEELSILQMLFPELRGYIENLDLVFNFCYDTGKAGILVAKEEDGRFHFLGKIK